MIKTKAGTYKKGIIPNPKAKKHTWILFSIGDIGLIVPSSLIKSPKDAKNVSQISCSASATPKILFAYINVVIIVMIKNAIPILIVGD